MQSPFSGMDPFIEACGLREGFHNRLVHKIDEALAPLLPPGYIIDTAIRASEAPEPVRMQAFVAEKFEEAFIEIYKQDEDGILVTCIEVLSPANKRPNTEGWRQYERKRQAMLLGQANFVEIDLLRGGDKMPMLSDWPDSPYSLLVCRASDAPYCRVWPAHFQQRLPPIPVPLLSPVPDLTLDLQPLLDGIYSLGRYHERIDYPRALAPALSEADAVWVRELLTNRPAPSRKTGGKSS